MLDAPEVGEGLEAGQDVTIVYRNYRGEVNQRHIQPSHIWFGSTSWHPDPQWIIVAIDLEKGAERSFALKDILDFSPE